MTTPHKTRVAKIQEALKRKEAAGWKRGTRADGTARVFWTDEERVKVVREAAKLITVDMSLTRKDALNMAQMVLEKPRQRAPFTSYSQEVKKWADPLFASEFAFLAKVKRQAEQAAAQTQAAEEERARNATITQAAEAAQAAADAAAALTAQPVPQLPAYTQPLMPPGMQFDPLALLLSGLRQRVVSELASVLADALSLALPQALAKMQLPQPQQQAPHAEQGKEARATVDNPFPHNPFPPGHAEPGASAAPLAHPPAQEEAPARALNDAPPRHVPFIRTESRPRKKSVLVVGLRGAQGELLKHEFGDVLDLRFHGANDSKHQLRDLATSCDSTVLFTGKMGHSAEAVVTARSKDWHRTDGGMTSLRDTLQRLVPAGVRTQ